MVFTMADTKKTGFGKTKVGLTICTVLVIALTFSNVWFFLENESLQNQVNSLEADKTVLQNQVSSLEADKNSLQTQVSSLEGDESQLESQVTDLETDKSNLQKQVSNLQSQVGILESEKSDLETQVNGLVDDKSSLESQISNLESEKTNLQTEINSLNEEIASLESQILNLTEITNMEKSVVWVDNETLIYQTNAFKTWQTFYANYPGLLLVRVQKIPEPDYAETGTLEIEVEVTSKPYISRQGTLHLSPGTGEYYYTSTALIPVADLTFPVSLQITVRNPSSETVRLAVTITYVY